MSLTVAGVLAPHLTDENVETLLTECQGMTKRAAEEHLVRLRPKRVFVPSIRNAPSSPRISTREEFAESTTPRQKLVRTRFQMSKRRTRRRLATSPPRCASGFTPAPATGASTGAEAGLRCTARTALQIEHERPFALHKNHDERFLKLF